MRYLLDTNILSHLVRDSSGNIAKRIAEAGPEHIATSIIVAAELRYGVAKGGFPRLHRQVEALLDVLHILPFEEPADKVYSRLRVDLARTGQMIGPNDLLIAAQAVALGLTIVTDNEREFARIEELRWENWLRD